MLIPHGGEDFCTLDAAFTSFVDPRKFGPRLNVQVQVRAGQAAWCCMVYRDGWLRDSVG